MTRRRGVTEQAAVAAIEQGCRILRLPTMRDRFVEIAAAAEREQLSYLGYLSGHPASSCRPWVPLTRTRQPDRYFEPRMPH